VQRRYSKIHNLENFIGLAGAESSDTCTEISGPQKIHSKEIETPEKHHKHEDSSLEHNHHGYAHSANCMDIKEKQTRPKGKLQFV
jgi:hypothetical protein